MTLTGTEICIIVVISIAIYIIMDSIKDIVEGHK